MGRETWQWKWEVKVGNQSRKKMLSGSRKWRWAVGRGVIFCKNYFNIEVTIFYFKRTFVKIFGM
jgi:hypothetical protein